jgi:coenzyme F420-dependent glucose-6-phosphate dehydrogenase
VVEIGYHASHEQFSPKELLEHVQAAEQAGFQAAMCSDHFYPWSENQGQAGFAWSWLGAALQATSLPFGVVTVPGGWRYHPAILAQAAATLAEMFPGRFWLAPGSGEWLNEHIVGARWPSKGERNERLKEAVGIMRALWAGETVTHHGHLQVDEAKLYTRPQTPPGVISAAITPETAAWLGGWADGLITVNKPHEELKQVVEAFREGGGEGKPMYLRAHLAYAKDEAEARHAAHEQWRTNIFNSSVLAELRTPQQFDAVAQFVQPQELDGHVRISADLERHLDWLQGDIALGFGAIYLHQVNRGQRLFIETFGNEVLPRLAKR